MLANVQQVFQPLTLTRSIGGKTLWMARARMDLAVPLLPEMRTPPIAGFTVNTERRICRLRAGINKTPPLARRVMGSRNAMRVGGEVHLAYRDRFTIIL